MSSAVTSSRESLEDWVIKFAIASTPCVIVGSVGLGSEGSDGALGSDWLLRLGLGILNNIALVGFGVGLRVGIVPAVASTATAGHVDLHIEYELQ